MHLSSGWRLSLAAVLVACAATPARGGWVQQVSGTAHDLHSVNFDHSTPNRAWACGDHGTIVYTADGGANWVVQNSGTTVNLYGIVYHEENGSVIAVGEKGTILRTTDRGTTWVPMVSPTTRTLRDTSDFRFYAVGDSGTIIKSVDWGVTWATIESQTTANLRSVIGLEPFPTAVGEAGTILRGNPSGTTWQTLDAGTTEDLNGVPFLLANLYVGDSGVIVRSADHGMTWTQRQSGTAHALHSIADANAAIYVVGAQGTILKSIDHGITWGHQACPVSQDLNGAFFYLDHRVGYAVGDGGIILKTTDAGGEIVTDAGPWPRPDDATNSTGHRLVACTPNPFRGTMQVTYRLAHDSTVALRVFNVKGRELGTVFEGSRMGGTHVATWHASRLPAGVYLVRLETGSTVETLRVTAVR